MSDSLSDANKQLRDVERISDAASELCEAIKRVYDPVFGKYTEDVLGIVNDELGGTGFRLHRK